MMSTTPTLKPKIYNVAIYCRLSKDDGNINDSSSIINQKQYLTEFVKKNNWDIYDYYVDEGYSGTNFNRPSFNKLITDIERGLVNCLIVKDLSRFGRNYLEVGQYTEEYFPKKGVRFIALNDNFDTVIDDNDFAPFKNIINEWYAKDISKKVKSVIKQKQKDGSVIVKPPYGYITDDIKGRIIDNEVAYIVRWIFEEYVNRNNTPKDIAEKLVEKQVLIPSFYYHTKNQTISEKYINMTRKEATAWNRGMVLKILKNEQYTGALVLNKVIKPSFKNKKQINVKEENWIIHKNKFDSIISEELFIRAKQQIKNNLCVKALPTENKYSNIIICDHCGKSLKYRKEKDIRGYGCETKGCAMNFMPIPDLDNIVNNELADLKIVILNNEKNIKEKIANFNTNQLTNNKSAKEVSALENRKNETVNKLNKAFEAYISEELPDIAYQGLAKKYRTELTDIESKIEIANTLKEEKPFNPNMAYEFINNIKMVKSNTNITRTLLNVFIEKILISKGEKTVRRSYTKNLRIEYKAINTILEDFIYERTTSIN